MVTVVDSVLKVVTVIDSVLKVVAVNKVANVTMLEFVDVKVAK
jgi:hypothetical protein